MPSSSTSKTIGKPFTELATVQSTNNYAMGLIHRGLAQHGAAWFAHEQTAGKGQRNKSWLTQPKENIILSVALNAKPLATLNPFLLSAAVALATRNFFNTYAVSDTLIKWPNDIYWCDRKAAGILIENVYRGSIWQWAVVGIGININQTKFDEQLLNPVSLKQITGKHYDCVALAKELCDHLQQQYQRLLNSKRSEIMTEYNENLYKKDETVQLKKDNIVFTATIKEVNNEGQLQLTNATYTSVNFGEVEWIIK